MSLAFSPDFVTFTQPVQLHMQLSNPSAAFECLQKTIAMEHIESSKKTATK